LLHVTTMLWRALPIAMLLELNDDVLPMMVGAYGC
jgi:hypothetical protein